MSERNISFSTPMVQAIRDGKKTQTRRVVKGPALEWLTNHQFVPEFVASPDNDMCPYGKVGDIMRVREATWMWCEKVPDGLTPKKRPKFRYVPEKHKPPIYVADHPAGTEKPTAKVTTGNDVFGKQVFLWRYKLPRFLPAWAVRTRLKITGVRIEKLLDISEADAKAEGVDDFVLDEGVQMWRSAYEGFSELWESINGEGSWNLNPWVWVLNFEPA